MPVAIERKPELDLTIFRATGDVPFSEQMDVLKAFYDGSPTTNVIWDFTEADEVDLSNDELRTIVQYTKSHAARRKRGHTALVVNTQLKYGLSRMASAFADIEETPWSMETFEEFEAAMAWISRTRQAPDDGGS